MDSTYDAPSDLAWLTHEELARLGRASPGVGVLTELFEVMFFASLQTEERQPITFDLTYMDPAHPDPYQPPGPRPDRWQIVPLGEDVPVTIQNLVKLAKASDPRTSSFAVFSSEDNGLKVWAMIDQGNRYHDFVHYDTDSGPDRPGVFQTAAISPGRLNVRVRYDLLAELNVHRITRPLGDPLRAGAVRDALQFGIDTFLQLVRDEAGDAYDLRCEWDFALAEDWLATIARILLRMRGLQHGGALLITPAATPNLDVKYEIYYDRLSDALRRLALSKIARTTASDTIATDYMDADEDHVPMDLYLDEAVAEAEVADIENEIDGAVWFIALLSRVDGLVLMDPDLCVRGFGVVITAEGQPEEVSVAGDDSATPGLLAASPYTTYGTRHRSMMRYCAATPGAVGFVVSQDGEVRATTLIGDQVVLFEGLQLQRLIVTAADDDDENRAFDESP